MIYDLANLDAGFRFCGEENRWGGGWRLSAMQKFGLQSIPGYLENGVPPKYGAGAEQVVASVHKNPLSKHAWVKRHIPPAGVVDPHPGGHEHTASADPHPAPPGIPWDSPQHDLLRVQRPEAAQDLVPGRLQARRVQGLAGGSMATSAATWNKCVTSMSRTAPVAS